MKLLNLESETETFNTSKISGIRNSYFRAFFWGREERTLVIRIETVRNLKWTFWINRSPGPTCSANWFFSHSQDLAIRHFFAVFSKCAFFDVDNILVSPKTQSNYLRVHIHVRMQCISWTYPIVFWIIKSRQKSFVFCRLQSKIRL